MADASLRVHRENLVARAVTAARGIEGVTGVALRMGWRRRGDAAPAPSDVLAEPAAAGEGETPPAIVHGPPLTLPADAPSTLTEALLRAARAPGERGTTYVLADDREDRQTYRDLYGDAARVLAGLRAAGLRPGDSVLLHCDDNRNFVTGFWACVLGGFVPTPVGIAPTYQWDNAVTRRMFGAWELLDRPPVLTDAALVAQVAEVRRLWGRDDVRVLAVEEVAALLPDPHPYAADPEHPVLHLLTSGSTGVPKCVRHCHRTVITRAYANAAANGFTESEVTLNFMPLDHVAGMAMHNVRDVILGCEHVNARTDSFIGDPLRWFTWIERYAVTNTSAPNFVITLVTKLADAVSRGSWDLSTVRDITNGGEPIISRTTHEFLRMTAPHGMAPDVMRPAWGMSELCGGAVHSTMDRDDETVGVVTVDHRSLGGRLRILPAPTTGHPTFTEAGVPAPGTSIRIVDATGAVLPEDHVGRLQVRGVTMMTGYHRNPDANREAFTDDGWFDTGDQAFVHRGRLTMTGREKDMIVIRSANYPCHEIESVVERVPGVLPTFVAACSEHDDESGTDELLVFAVLEASHPDEQRAVIRDIRTRLSREVALRPREVIPVPLAAFPKTSAGKIERRRLLAEYQANAFDDVLAGVTGAEADDDWLFAPVWTPVTGTPSTAPAGTWLLFADASLAERLHAVRPSPATTVVVTPGTGFRRRTAGAYEIDPADPAHYVSLLAEVRRERGPVDAVVHAWAATEPRTGPPALEASVLSVARLYRAVEHSGASPSILIVTSGGCAVGEASLRPEHATITPFVRTANAERTGGRLRQLDLPTDVAPDEAVAAIHAELGDHGGDDVVAVRGGRRLVCRLRPTDTSASGTSYRIRSEGLYLVTGGLGAIGSELARLLATEHRATVVLVGRSAPVGPLEQRLARLTALGGVEYQRADVGDAQAVRAVVDAAEKRHGRPLDGVLHVAGADIAGNWSDLDAHLLSRENDAEFWRMFHAKILGTWALADVLRDHADALLVLFSSVNGHFGGSGFGAYAAASGFPAAFAEQWRRAGHAVQCQMWSRWSWPGATDSSIGALRRRGLRVIESDHGGRLFTEALESGHTQVLIGLDAGNAEMIRELDTADVAAVELTVAQPPGAPSRLAEVRRVAESLLAPVGIAVSVRASEPGSSGDRAAVHPWDEVTEKALVAVWREVFDTSQLRPDDDFFSLGGTSMMAMQIIDGINSAYGRSFTILDLYDNPTLAGLVSLVRQDS